MPQKFTFILLFFSSLVSAQIGGKYVYQFLNLSTSPRQAALGGKLVTLTDYDVNQMHYNPASINPDMDNNFAVNYGSLFGEISYGTAAYAYSWDRHVQTIAVGINYINYGTFDGRDELGLETGNFTGSEAALSVGYGYNIPWTDVYIGANAKLISSTLESYNSFGGALDLGFLYKDEDNDIHYGLAIRNIGTQLTTYSETREKLPLSIDAGISQLAPNVPIRWHITLENLQQWNIAFNNPNRAQSTLEGEVIEEKVSFFNNALRHVILGAEFFPEKGFNLRVGYNFRKSEELRIVEQRHFSGISLGFGIKFNNIRFNYSYSRLTSAANTSLFGLMIHFE